MCWNYSMDRDILLIAKAAGQAIVVKFDMGCELPLKSLRL